VITLSLYERVMGERFALLPSAVQRFHRLRGQVVLHGRVQTDAPATWLAAVLARMLGTPRHASEGALRFELDAGTDVEHWTRHFPQRTMSSRLQWRAGRVEERLGAARLSFDLTAGEGALRMRLVHMRFLGVPCPRWLMPRITAEESGDGEHLHFRVTAALPWLGTVASYRGHLVLASEVPR
jgi:hypothetical protein